jgi:hypothetical protein
VTAPVQIVIAVLALIAAARTRLTATLYGAPVSIPVLWLVALAVVLALAVVVLAIVRSMLRDGWPRLVTT